MTSACSLFQVSAIFVAALALSTSAVAAGAPKLSDEFPQETAALVDATTAYFDAIEGLPQGQKRDRAPVIRMPSFAQKIRADAGTEPLTRHGPVHHLTGYQINWYPVDRLLGSVDFMGTWDGNRNLVCGYLIWDLSKPDQPVLDDVIANFLELDDLSRMSAPMAHAALLEANCAFGAIEQNYEFFDISG